MTTETKLSNAELIAEVRREYTRYIAGTAHERIEHRLADALEQSEKSLHTWVRRCERNRSTIAQSRAEAQRYREALEWIRELDRDPYSHAVNAGECAICKAKEALAPTDKTDVPGRSP